MEKENDFKSSNGDGAKQTFRPRRERKEVTVAEDKLAVNAPEEVLQNEDTKPRRRRAADLADEPEKGTENGGWMSMTSDSKTQVKKQSDEGVEIVPQASNRDKHFQENDDEGIMIIPDLDEDGADADQRIAHAPRNINRKIPTLFDLENEVKAAVTSADSGFDLGILLCTLVPSSFLSEADNPWTFENLLRDVTDELTATSKTVTETSVKPVVVANTAEKTKVLAKSAVPPTKSQEQQGRIGK